MSAEAVHRGAARVNAQLATLIDSPQIGPFRSWVPTVLLYTISQTVDAATVAKYGPPCTRGHDARRGVINRKLAGGPAASRDYKLLRDLSEHWRYDGQSPTEPEITEAWRLARAVLTAIGEPWPPPLTAQPKEPQSPAV